ncbi:MAG: hypothetical protein PHZ07_02265, partial [Patescibacteria group bacterium]|nr:hypothetical protein [Patescibacteria group bacterium]
MINKNWTIFNTKPFISDEVFKITKKVIPSTWSIKKIDRSIVIESNISKKKIIIFVYADRPTQSISVYKINGIPSSKIEMQINNGLNQELWVKKLIKEIDFLSNKFSKLELSTIINSLPLLNKYAKKLSGSLSNYALVWRDHFVEDSVALLHAFEVAGIKPENIYTLDKGDKTLKRLRIEASFKDMGYYCSLFDNLYLDPILEKKEIKRIKKSILDFVSLMKKKGKKIILIDD